MTNTPQMSEEAIKSLASLILNQAEKSDVDALIYAVNYSKYEDDPVGFCEEVLGETLTDDIKEMMESVRDNQVTIAVSANATGKTHAAARVSVWYYLCHDETKVFTAAAPPFENLKNILWGEIGQVIRDHPELFKGQDHTSLDIRRGPQEFLTGVTIPSAGTEEEKESKFSGKHQSFLLFALDEGDAIPDAVYRGIESCMSGGHVRLLIMFNPRKSSGAVYRMIRDARAGAGEAHVVHLSAFRHPNVITGKDTIPGAVTRDKTIKRINLWCRPLRPGDKESERSVFTLPDFLAGTTTERKKGIYFPRLQPGKYKIVNPAFSYMVLGQYPAQGSNQLISEEWISAARIRHDLYVAEYGDAPPQAGRGIMGLDVAEMGDDENIAVARYGGYLTQFDAWSEVDPRVTGVKAVAWYQDHEGITRANVDATGVGSGVAPHMQETEGVVATGIKVAESPTVTTELGDFGLLRDELLWRIKEWLRTDSSAMLPPDEDLIEELMALTYDTSTGKVRVIKTDEMKTILGRSPDRLMALAMTFAGSTGFFSDCDFEAFPSED